MKTRMWIAVAVAAAALAIAMISAPAAWANYTPAPNGPSQAQGRMGEGRGMGQGNRMGGQEQSLVGVAAQQLGMEQADLLAQLQGGKTIAQVAESKDVATDTIVNAFVASHEPRLAQAVANGRMTQDDADKRLATMRSMVTARVYQEWSQQGPHAGNGNGDGTCDHAGPGNNA